MLEVQNVKKSYGDAVILDGVTFRLRPKDRIAMVGRNGCGKSTLLQIIAGLVEPDSGAVDCAAGLAIAYLPQYAVAGSSRSLIDEMRDVFEEVHWLERHQRHLEAAMVGRSPSDPELQRLIQEHSELHAEFERRDGYTIEARIGAVLAGLGFGPEDYSKQVDQLSGGWQMRVALARLLLADADVLLLDEPTNHLDLSAVEWLEDYLQRYQGAVVIVSHDRYLLDRTTNGTIEIENGSLIEYPGSYSWYTRERQRRLDAQQTAYERQQEYLNQQMAFVERFRASARRASQARSRERMLSRLEKLEAPHREKQMVFHLPPCPPSGREVVVLRNVSKSYDSTAVLTNCDLLIEQGERIGLVGPNGAGKTTLIRLLARTERPDRGVVAHGVGVRVAYYAQHQADTLDPSKTVLQEVYGASRNGVAVGETRSLLGRLLFSQDDVFKPIAVLSGGERSRVALAKMLLRPANLLLMDEPTNHLDISSREVMEEALREYAGTVVVASHDRFFLDRVATKTIELRDCHLAIFLGNYSYYRQRQQVQAVIAGEDQSGVGTREPSPRREERQSGTRSRPSERDLADIERQIEALESRVTELADILGQPSLYTDGQNPVDVIAEYETAVEKLNDLTERWEQLVEAL